jgi:hypothetical protein
MGAQQKPEISVVIRTHNPRPDYLHRVLGSLQIQTLPLAKWELLLVDNASTPPLAESFSLAWHPQGRHVREEKLGVTYATLCAIRQFTGELFVMVDDDNVLAPDYLAETLAIAGQNPEAGAWGGNVRLTFEAPPPEWTRRYWHLLAQQNVTVDSKTWLDDCSQPLPVGAACCFRRKVVERYARILATSGLRRSFDRHGSSLVSAGDTDMVLCATDVGLYRALFKSLFCEHLIPPQRLTEAYLMRLAEGIRYSGDALKMLRYQDQLPPPVNAWWWIKYACASALKTGHKRLYFQARKQGQRRARKLYEAIKAGANPSALEEIRPA